MPPTIVILNGDVHTATNIIFGNQGLVIYLTSEKVLFVPVRDGDAVRLSVGGAPVERLIVNSPYWVIQ